MLEIWRNKDLELSTVELRKKGHGEHESRHLGDQVTAMKRHSLNYALENKLNTGVLGWLGGFSVQPLVMNSWTWDPVPRGAPHSVRESA